MAPRTILPPPPIHCLSPEESKSSHATIIDHARYRAIGPTSHNTAGRMRESEFSFNGTRRCVPVKWTPYIDKSPRVNHLIRRQSGQCCGRGLCLMKSITREPSHPILLLTSLCLLAAGWLADLTHLVLHSWHICLGLDVSKSSFRYQVVFYTSIAGVVLGASGSDCVLVTRAQSKLFSWPKQGITAKLLASGKGNDMTLHGRDVSEDD
ncbi:hypothetical protein V8C42DRAFT_259988 [Trichoderma barbatum]